MKTMFRPVLLLALLGLILAGCNFDVPLTAKPTRPINDQLVGDWLSTDTDAARVVRMNVRKLDETTYAVSYDGDLYRAFHSDFAGLSLVSAQDLNSRERKYAYFTWQLSADGARLTLKGVSTRVIPDTTKDAGVIQELIKKNRSNPELFGEEAVFTRKKADRS